MPASHDVLVIGGGLVGSCLAIALDGLGLRVGLVDGSADGALPAVFDQRNLSLADASVNALTALGVLPLLRTPTGPIRRIHASRRGDLGRVVLDAAEHGRDAFGQVVVARDLGEALEARLAQLPRIARHRPCRFVALADAPDDAGERQVMLDGDGGPMTLGTRLLVAADGSRSSVRAALGIDVDEHDYRQTLLVARLRTSRPPDGTAYERLCDDGPTALLPRSDRHYGLVHAVATEDAAAVQALDDAAFLDRVQHAFGWRAGRLLAVGERSAYPAFSLVARSTVAPRAVLVGNAAQTLHPIGAQGFNLGLRDAMTLADVLASAGAGEADPGDAALLARHVALRCDDRAETLALSDGLARAGSTPGALVSSLRSLGLLALAADPGLRARLAGGAMGYRGHVPTRCRAPAR